MQMKLLRRSDVTETSAQTESTIPIKISKLASQMMTDQATQVVLDDIPDADAFLRPALEALVMRTLEDAFVEALEEEEINEIRRRRIEFQQKKLAELTTSQLMSIDTVDP